MCHGPGGGVVHMRPSPRDAVRAPLPSRSPIRVSRTEAVADHPVPQRRTRRRRRRHGWSPPARTARCRGRRIELGGKPVVQQNESGQDALPGTALQAACGHRRGCHTEFREDTRTDHAGDGVRVQHGEIVGSGSAPHAPGMRRPEHGEAADRLRRRPPVDRSRAGGRARPDPSRPGRTLPERPHSVQLTEWAIRATTMGAPEGRDGVSARRPASCRGSRGRSG